MKKNISILIFFQLIYTSLLSQETYYKGYLIKNSGDTIKGYFARFSPQRIPSRLMFKHFDIDFIHQLRSNEFKSLALNNGLYYERKLLGNKPVFARLNESRGVKLWYYKGQYYLEVGKDTLVNITRMPVMAYQKNYPNRQVFLSEYFSNHIGSPADSVKSRMLIQHIDSVIEENRGKKQNIRELIVCKMYSLYRQFGLTIGTGTVHQQIIQPSRSNPIPALDKYDNVIFAGVYFHKNFYYLPQIYLHMEANVQLPQKFTSSREELYTYDEKFYELHLQYQKLQIPILVGYYLPYTRNCLKIKGGVTFNWLINTSITLYSINHNISSNTVTTFIYHDLLKFKKTFWQGVLELDYHPQNSNLPFYVGLRFEEIIYPWINQGPSTYHYRSNAEQKFNQLSFVIGYSFWKGR